MLYAVIDTSMLISFALTAGDITRQIIGAWRAGEFMLLTTPQTRAELRQVLERPHIVTRTKEPLGWLADELERVSVRLPGRLSAAGVCRDPKDEIFLACAAEGRAHYLVSSDRDLLDLGRYQETCILNPGQFLIVLQLRRLSVAEIRRQYSSAALSTIQSSLCLDAETEQKVASAVSET